MQDTTISSWKETHYEQLAAFWWDKSEPFWTLRRFDELKVDWNRARLRFGLPGSV